MKLTIITSAKEFEAQNYVLGQLMRMVADAEPDAHGFSADEIEHTRKFREKLLNAFLATTKTTDQ